MNEFTSESFTELTEQPHPDWCARDRCYGFLVDAADHGSLMIERGSAMAQIDQLVEWIGGAYLDGTPGVFAWMNGEEIIGDSGTYLTSADCRDLASVLLQAADQLDALPADVT